MNGYLHGTNFNVLACDYACVSQRGYISAVVLLDDVATAVVKSITNMVAGGMDQTKLILSGMSLGSQLSGYIGRKLSFKPAKIIAGDPAGPLFNFVSPSISASDAECVICIHCDQGFYGNAQACNHTDFYPNGGVRLQPGCSVSSAEPSCSHGRCEEYMAEAARHSNDFIGVKCNSWDGFKAGKCDNNVTVPMGLTTPCSATGKFYLQTNSASPYGKGSAGIVYHS
ncbi:lipase member H-B-like [Augochlora pura]